MRVAFLAVCSLGLVGCAAKSGALTAAEAKAGGQALAAEVEAGASGFGPVNEGATALPACVTLSGDTADPDGDSIPNQATLTFDCTSTTGAITTTVAGTEAVSDDQPNAVAWAFSANVDLQGATTVGTASVTTDRHGTVVASQGSALGPFSLARTLVVSTTIATATAMTTVDVDNAWTITYTPQASWSPGGVVISGTLDAAGSWHVSVGTHDADWTLATPTALTLDPTCPTRVTAGTVTGSYEDARGAHMVTVAWTGGGASTVTAS